MKSKRLGGNFTLHRARHILPARQALIDRITDRANVIETGTEPYGFRRPLEKRNLM
jgi:hypothetical protein